jgi:hypothetical protein
MFKNEYDIVITLDVAQYFVSDIPRDLRNLDLNKMYVANFEKFDGYNPRFALSNAENIIFYLEKIDYVLGDGHNIPDGMICPSSRSNYIEAYMKFFDVPRDEVLYIPNLHPEWQLKTYLDTVGKKKVVEINIRFYRIRSNAQLEGITEEDAELYNVKLCPEQTK